MHVFLRYLLWEFHYSRFCLCHENDKRFSETLWLPSKWYFQWIYLIYRWIIALFFLVNLVVSGLNYSGGARYLILLTHWNFIVLICHLLWSAIFVTVRYFQVHVFCRERFEARKKLSNYQVYDKPAGCCGVQEDGTVWYQKVQWLLFTIGNEAAIGGTILYWALIYRGGSQGYISIVTHAINGVAGFLDICFSGVPIRILHVVYPFVYCCVYSVFTGIYFGAGGTNNGNSYIYSVINYEVSPGIAAGYILGVTLVFCPVVHLLLWGLYLAREGLLYLVMEICCNKDQPQLASSDDEVKEVSV